LNERRKREIFFIASLFSHESQNSSKISFLQYKVIRPYVYIDFSASDATGRKEREEERERGGDLMTKLYRK